MIHNGLRHRLLSMRPNSCPIPTGHVRIMRILLRHYSLRRFIRFLLHFRLSLLLALRTWWAYIMYQGQHLITWRLISRLVSVKCIRSKHFDFYDSVYLRGAICGCFFESTGLGCGLLLYHRQFDTLILLHMCVHSRQHEILIHGNPLQQRVWNLMLLACCAKPKPFSLSNVLAPRPYNRMDSRPFDFIRPHRLFAPEITHFLPILTLKYLNPPTIL